MIASGVFDGARCYVFATSWAAPVVDEEPLIASILGKTTISDDRYVIENMGLLDAPQSNRRHYRHRNLPACVRPGWVRQGPRPAHRDRNAYARHRQLYRARLRACGGGRLFRRRHDCIHEQAEHGPAADPDHGARRRRYADAAGAAVLRGDGRHYLHAHSGLP